MLLTCAQIAERARQLQAEAKRAEAELRRIEEARASAIAGRGPPTDAVSLFAAAAAGTEAERARLAGGGRSRDATALGVIQPPFAQAVQEVAQAREEEQEETTP